ncbi:hypothetical protein [Sphaerisporangium perillae]|uniref:hypothetical protein n=1 Tax=Sphaerisporangium perillae TaxID=2935860 RepID=UPI0020101B74|nr:hypothetical protein [Sphaerisporangium perillae]
MTTETPLLEAWFATMDSDEPERVLEKITDDFQMSVVFSKGDSRTAEFCGDRAGLVGYLEQREKNALVHHLLRTAAVGDVELGLGTVTRDGQFEASFNVTAFVEPASGRCRRLLICRTPEIAFPLSD